MLLLFLKKAGFSNFMFRMKLGNEYSLSVKCLEVYISVLKSIEMEYCWEYCQGVHPTLKKVAVCHAFLFTL